MAEFIPTFVFLLLLALVLYGIPYTLGRIRRVKSKIQRQKNLNDNLVITDYTIHHELSPVELAFLFDGHFGKNEVAGAVLYLAHKKQLLIRRTEGALTLRIHPDRDRKLLKQYENEILAILTDVQEVDIKLDRLSLLHSNRVERDIADKIFYQLERKGYIKLGKGVSLAKAERRTPFIVALIFKPLLFVVLSVVLSALALKLTNRTPTNALQLTMIAGPAIASYGYDFLYKPIRRFVLRHRWATDKYYRRLPQIEGFRTYLRTVEVPRQQELKFVDGTLVIPELVPYAVAFGYNRKWKRLLIKHRVDT